MCSGGNWLVVGNDEEVRVWKSYIGGHVNGLLLLGDGSIKFAERHDTFVAENVVSVKPINIECRMLYICPLLCVRRSSLKLPGCCQKMFVDAPAQCTQIVENIKFSTRSCESIFVMEDVVCAHCSLSFTRDGIENVCKHRFCKACFHLLWRRQSKCPICSAHLVSMFAINPKLLNLKETLLKILNSEMSCLVFSRVYCNAKKVLGENVSEENCVKYFYNVEHVDVCVFEEGWCNNFVRNRLRRVFSTYDSKMILLSPVQSYTHSFL